MEGELTEKALSITVALFAGYSFFRISYLTRFSLDHLRTDRLALHLFGYAAFFAMAGAGVAQIMPYVPTPQWSWGIQGWLQGVQDSVAFLGLSPTTINAVILAGIAGLAHNSYVLLQMRNDPAVILTRFDPSKSLRARMRMAGIARYVRQSNDPMLRTLFRATVLQKLVMVTLKNDKVYVGALLVPAAGDPTRPITSIKLFPIASGTRDKRTKKVTLSTAYAEFMGQLSRPQIPPGRYDSSDPFLSIEAVLKFSETETERIDSEDLGIVVVWNQVHSLTLFDRHVFRWFEGKDMEERQKAADRKRRIIEKRSLQRRLKQR